MQNSPSAKIASARPFYSLHADAYDALINDPVEPWVDWIDGRLRASGFESAAVLDAGCGTGRHAAALVARGHRLTLTDAAPELLAQARARCPGVRAIVADICSVPLNESFDAVTCRGVLNDLVEDKERDRALDTFARLTAPRGILILDVREHDASRSRADGTWHTKQVRLADNSTLKFSSRPTWEAEHIVVEERYEFTDPDGVPSPPREYLFRMRPWTATELHDRLRRAGFQHVELQPGVGRRTSDRLLVTARH